MTGRSQWPLGLRRRSVAARLLRSWFRIPPGAWFVCCERCVLSDRGLCDELITRPEESYWLWCVVVCDLESLWMRSPCPTEGSPGKNKQTYERTTFEERGGAVGWGTALQTGRSRVRFAMGVIEIFHWHNLSGLTITLGPTQPLTEMSTRTISWGVKAAGEQDWQHYHLLVLIVLKSWSLNLLEPSGPVMGLLYRLLDDWFIKIRHFSALWRCQNFMTKAKVNDKILPRTDHEGPEENTGIAVLFL